MPAPLPIQPPRPLRGGLASVAEDLNALMPVADWATGVQYTPQCDAVGFVWGCDTLNQSGGEGKAPTTLDLHEDWYPATVGTRVECTVAGSQTVIGDVVRQVATQALERVRYSELAGILFTGEVGRADVNPSFFSDATLPDGFDNDAPAGLLSTIQGMLDAACTCWDQQLVFHVPRSYLPHFLNQTIVEYNAATGQYTMGDHLVSFDCYVNQGPDALSGGDPLPAADGSEVWMYATSRPLIGLDPRIDVQSTIADPRMNLYNVVAEQGAIAIVNPCCIIGAKAKICAC